jgi:hypothetical protein
LSGGFTVFVAMLSVAYNLKCGTVSDDTEMAVVGTCHGLILGTIPVFSWRD